jgi:hypothetical protein
VPEQKVMFRQNPNTRLPCIVSGFKKLTVGATPLAIIL